LVNEIHPIARAVIDAEFRDPLANRTDITWVIQGQSPDPNVDPSLGYSVTQGGKPHAIGTRLPDFDHASLYPKRYGVASGCLVRLALPLSGRQGACGGAA
jgi:hypothetical protein